jgi:eukaryotic-like serine/threonine-protein kinase
MTPELSQRVSIVWHEFRALSAAEAERFLRKLRESDPDLAGELDVLLGAQGPGQGERPSAPLAESPPGGPHPPGPAGEVMPTVPEQLRLTAGCWQAAHETPSEAGPLGPSLGRILGRYHVLRAVGRGGFGVVWQAYDPVLQKYVAVKAPRPRQPGRPLPQATFLHEARKAASLRHPAIVQVYDVGEGEGGWYIISEFVEGESLAARMAGDRLPFDRSARIIATVAGALHAAHLAGLVHRDVKPGNVLLDRAGNAYLTDFGLAVREDEQLAERTKVSGTLAYMPPEQICGDTHLMDGRADIYSLGAVLYELLTGRPLFRARNVEEYRELILRREPRPPRSIDDTIPEELERICLKCLAKHVRDRYKTAQDLADELVAWLARADRLPAPPPRLPGSVPGWLKAAVAGTLVLSLAGGAVGVAVLSGALAGGRPLPTSPEQPGGPSRVVDRGPKEPTVKELVWPRGRDTSKWEVLEATNQLKIYTNSTGMLQLGEADADSWDFSATLGQLAAAGRIGLFLGYRKDPETTTASFELIYLVVDARGQASLLRSVESYRYDAPFTNTTGTTYASVQPTNLLPENTIRLVVRGNRLSEVRFNGKVLPGMLDGTARPPAAGAFGVFNRDSDGVVSNLLFKDKPIPLLADASPRAPEKP